MLNNIRNFSKTWFAKILLVVIIIPFVFWGMGGVFSGGNTNNIAKINNKSISTQDFIDFLNSSNISSSYIKDNIDKNFLEEMLSELISRNMLDLEIKSLNIKISDQILNDIIKKDNNFLDKNKIFSRTKYEKFLLESGIAAPNYEYQLRQRELKKILFSYISGGIKSPFFLTNNTYKDQTKEIKIKYISLENLYKKKENFSKEEILTFINENKDNLKVKNITFNYSIINPENLIGVNKFNQEFFNKIDDIENEITNGITYSELVNKYDLNSILVNNYNQNNNVNSEKKEEELFQIILNKSEDNKIELIDINDNYILYEIKSVSNILPNNNDELFIERIKNILFNQSKFKFYNDLIKKINDKKFTEKNFEEISKNNFTNIENIKLKSIRDDAIFTADGVKYLYALSKNDFGVIGDKEKNIYLVQLLDIYEKNIQKSDNDYKNFNTQTNFKIRDSLYQSYDLMLNKKYKVKINQKTLERVKNYYQ